MIRSMTGYGRAEGRHKGTPITVEVRSVNHRHSEVMAKLPRALQAHEDRIRDLVQDRLARALKALDQMRRHEGRTLERDLLARLQEVEGRLRTIRQRLPAIVDERAARLQERVKRLLEGAGAGRDSVDQSRLAQEVALLADRSDVSEELTRLDSHLDQFRAFLRKTEPVGRSLDFLLQEMNREINTIGSKVGDTAVTQEVVAVKAELEKIREQVQNVE